MVTRKKQPRTRSVLEQVVWLVGFAVSLLALILRHDGKMGASGTTHMAAERADEGVIEFYQRFPKP
jgi:hypothetical protein